MDASPSYVVSLQQARPRSIAAVRARLAPSRIPSEFGRYLDQVYASRASGIALDGQNIFVYSDASDAPGHLDVEFGVGIKGPIVPVGNVRAVELPVGQVAMTTHRGSYAGLGAAHAAVHAWCRSHSRALAGVRWEIYGHMAEGKVPETEIYYLLRNAEEAPVGL